MAELKRTYNIPLRKEFMKVPAYRRAKKAVNAIRLFLERHMKGEVKIGRKLNMLLWEHGIKNPPHHVKVDAVKDDKNIIKAELTGFVFEERKPIEKGKVKETLEMLKGKETKEDNSEKTAETKDENRPPKKKKSA